MMLTLPTPSPGELAMLLIDARAVLEIGKADEARAMTLRVLAGAEAQQDKLLEARALASLAQCDRLSSRFRRSHEASQRAAHLFRMTGDVAGEIESLSILAHSASKLGRNEEAVEAALLGVRIGESLPFSSQQAVSHNSLGIAYCWSRHFGKAEAAFDAAARLASRGARPASAFHPRQNQVWAECLRIATERFHAGRTPALDRLEAATEECLRLFAIGAASPLQAETHGRVEATWHLGLAIVHCWMGDMGRAQTAMLDAEKWLAGERTAAWLHALHAWVKTEWAWSLGDWLAAEQWSACLVDRGTRADHEQLAGVGHLLASQIFDCQNKHDDALEELRRLRMREQRVRAEGIESRSRLVKWQVEARSPISSPHVADSRAALVERQSLEDPLTGLANWRCIERRLSELMDARDPCAMPLCLLLIDVERFHDINEAFSHVVGDRVLKTIARLLVAHVRDADLAVRLENDVFAVVLQSISGRTSMLVSERISRAIARFDWQGIAKGLHVRVRTGLVSPHEQERVDALLGRCFDVLGDTSVIPLTPLPAK
jgi:diguanylate cyclase (GGDEF)-like protein